jgi:hypothetical protein
MNWAACLLFLVSLFQPMEHHTVPGPCSWPCLYPFTYTVFDNSIIFVLSPLFFIFQLLAWSDFRLFFAGVVYSLIGVGEMLMLLTPVLENKINSPFRQNLHLLLACLAAASVLSYSLFSDLRYGVDPLLIGYYFLVAAFVLAALASILRYHIRHYERPFKLSS